jgi:putative SOS response-associated peptidase YedK
VSRPPEFREIKVRWNLFNDLPELKRSYNIGPDYRDDIAVVGRGEHGNEGRLMHWPRIPAFAKTMRLEYSTSNATAERLRQSAVYKRLVGKRRCIIPVQGFYEWQGAKPPKTPFYIHLKSDEPFSLAGLWDAWKNPDDGSLLQLFTTITTEPNELMKPIHRRMPVILQRDDEDKWLDCAANPFDAVQGLLKPFPADLMASHEVSKRVNNPRYDAPDCVVPLEG